jgi:hypothetical protein
MAEKVPRVLFPHIKKSFFCSSFLSYFCRARLEIEKNILNKGEKAFHSNLGKRTV